MEDLPHKQKIFIMIAVMSAIFFSAVNMTIIGTSLPKIVSQIGGFEYFSWVFTIYMLTATVTAMLVGKLSDIYGRKVFILIGIGIFMIGAFLCGTADTIFQLIIYRGIQGLGGGMIMSSAFATVGDLFSPRERGRWQGIISSVFGLSSLVGPTLGGYIVDNFNWHWVFWVFLPIGIFAFVLILKLYPRFERQEKKEPIDFLGSFVLATTIIALLLGFSWGGNQYEWVSFEIIGLFSLALFLFISLIFIETKAKSPVIPLHLFKNSVFVISNIGGLFLSIGMFGLVMYIPFYVQGVLGYSATTSGILEMFLVMGMVTFSIISGQLITKTGKYKKLAIVGLFIMAAMLFFHSFLTSNTTLINLIVLLIIFGIGMGLAMPVFQVTVQNSVKHKYLGVATGIMQMFRQVGGTVGVAILGTVMASQMKSQIESKEVTIHHDTPAVLFPSHTI